MKTRPCSRLTAVFDVGFQNLIKDVMEFWLRLGVDGFYMPDVRHYLNVGTAPGRISAIVRGIRFYSQEDNRVLRLWNIVFVFAFCRIAGSLDDKC